MKNTIIAAAAACILCTCATIAQPVASDSTLRVLLARELRDEMSNPLFTNTIAAVEISDPVTGEVLYSHNASLLLRPASVMKLVTTGAAVLAYPDTARFVTELRVGPSARGGYDKLYVRGSGDPFMSMENIDSLAQMLRREGVRSIDSVILLDDDDDAPPYGPGWMWDDEASDFMPFMTDFMVSGGVWHVTASATNASQSVAVTVEPRCDQAHVKSTARRGAHDSLRIRRDGRSNDILVSGTLPADEVRTQVVGMWKPQDVFLSLLRRSLGARGIRLPRREGAGDDDRSARTVARVSHRLPDVLKLVNTDSDNLCAEAVLRLLGSRRGEASFTSGVKAVRHILDSAGVRISGLHQVDGSGLSEYNLVDAGMLGSLLRRMYREDVRERYIRTLATGGKGTLRTRLTDLPSGVRVHAKTGTFTGVSGLAGYMTSERTQPLAFVILMQNFIGESAPFRAVQDRIVQRCVEAVTAAQNSVRQPR